MTESTGPSTSPLPFPADGFHAAWTTWDGAHTVAVDLTWENEAWTATGRLDQHDVDFVVRLSPFWNVRQFLLFRDLDEPDLWIGTDGRGRWGEMNGAHRTDLDGAFDLHLGPEPFTHAIPIRRMSLPVGEAAELSSLRIDVDTLGVVPHTVVYERLGPRRWAVVRDGRRIEFDVDDHGLPLDVDGEFRRVHTADHG